MSEHNITPGDALLGEIVITAALTEADSISIRNGLDFAYHSGREAAANAIEAHCHAMCQLQEEMVECSAQCGDPDSCTHRLNHSYESRVCSVHRSLANIARGQK